MKTLALALVLAGLAISPVLKADEAAAPATNTTQKVAKPNHKAKNAAKKECLKDNPSLKGKELHECIKSKLVK